MRAALFVALWAVLSVPVALLITAVIRASSRAELSEQVETYLRQLRVRPGVHRLARAVRLSMVFGGLALLAIGGFRLVADVPERIIVAGINNRDLFGPGPGQQAGPGPTTTSTAPAAVADTAAPAAHPYWGGSETADSAADGEVAAASTAVTWQAWFDESEPAEDAPAPETEPVPDEPETADRREDEVEAREERENDDDDRDGDEERDEDDEDDDDEDDDESPTTTAPPAETTTTTQPPQETTTTTEPQPTTTTTTEPPPTTTTTEPAPEGEPPPEEDPTNGNGNGSSPDEA